MDSNESVLNATISTFPPSVNKLYTKTKWGQTRSAAAKKFKLEASLELAKQWAFASPLPRDTPLELSLRFYFPVLQNAGWPKTKTKYKKQDVSNYIKLLEDIIVSATGVDDSNHHAVHAYKLEDAKNPRIEVTIKCMSNQMNSDT